MAVLLYVLAAVGGLLILYGGILTGVADRGNRQGPVGVVVAGALIYGGAGATLWHWSIAPTMLILILTVGFAAFASQEKLNG